MPTGQETAWSHSCENLYNAIEVGDLDSKFAHLVLRKAAATVCLVPRGPGCATVRLSTDTLTEFAGSLNVG